jgi:hypothetical protein
MACVVVPLSPLHCGDERRARARDHGNDGWPSGGMHPLPDSWGGNRRRSTARCAHVVVRSLFALQR